MKLFMINLSERDVSTHPATGESILQAIEPDLSMVNSSVTPVLHSNL
jgi:hypothetical protein